MDLDLLAQPFLIAQTLGDRYTPQPFDSPRPHKGQGTRDAQMPLLRYLLDKININTKKVSGGTSGTKNWSRGGGPEGDISFMLIIDIWYRGI